MNHKDIETNIPGYTVNLDPDTFKWVGATVTPGGPNFSGSQKSVITKIAAEQGWSDEDLAVTLAKIA